MKWNCRSGDGYWLEFSLLLLAKALICSRQVQAQECAFAVSLELGATGEMVLYDGVDSAAGTVTFQVVYEGQAWIGFGRSDDGEMVGGEVVIGLPDEDRVEKYALTATNRGGVNPMVAQTLINPSIVQNETHTILTYTKLLEEEGELSISPSERQTWIWAHGTGNELAIHAIAGQLSFELTACAQSVFDNESLAPSAAEVTLAPTVAVVETTSPTQTDTAAPVVVTARPTHVDTKAPEATVRPTFKNTEGNLMSPEPTATKVPVSTSISSPQVKDQSLSSEVIIALICAMAFVICFGIGVWGLLHYKKLQDVSARDSRNNENAEEFGRAPVVATVDAAPVATRRVGRIQKTSSTRNNPIPAPQYKDQVREIVKPVGGIREVLPVVPARVADVTRDQEQLGNVKLPIRLDP